jgi:hypothetical protein
MTRGRNPYAGSHLTMRGTLSHRRLFGTWSLLKRGIMGGFHKVSRKFLLYVAEFPFRYNNRTNGDIFSAAIARC